jgi:hypothetical protein
MKLDEVARILAEVERQLAGVLSAEAEPVVQRLLNLVEQLVTEQRGLLAEVQRLRELLEQKKRSKTTAGEAEPPAGPSSVSPHPLAAAGMRVARRGSWLAWERRSRR